MADIRLFIKSVLKGSVKTVNGSTPPPPIQSMWIGKKLTTMERMCISSFINNGHEYVLYVYDDVKNAPKGTVIKDANAIIDASRIFKYRTHDSYAGFSNLFRYKLLYEMGGYWVDTDIFCLKPFPMDKNYVFASQRMPNIGKIRVNCCVMKVPAKSKFVGFCYKESSMKEPTMLKWGETGPRLITEAVTKYKMWRNVLSPEAFCPIEWWKWDRLITESDMAVFNDSLAVHFWNEMWRRNNVDRSIQHKKECLYEQLKALSQSRN